MPIVIDGGRVPIPFGQKRASSVRQSMSDAQAGRLRIALINNMPDPALEDTEMQFYNFSMPLPATFQFPSSSTRCRGFPAAIAGCGIWTTFTLVSTIFGATFDGVIVTGTEPRQPNLREEPYWTP